MMLLFVFGFPQKSQSISISNILYGQSLNNNERVCNQY